MQTTNIPPAGKDRLTTLAPELLQMIVDLLFACHEPEWILHSQPELLALSALSGGANHPLDHLAATSKALRTAVEAYCQHFAERYRDARYQCRPNTINLAIGTDFAIPWKMGFLRGHHGLLTWASQHCVFCGKKSVRKATLMNGLHCCKPCDREQWPDKITKTLAREKYHLTSGQLLPYLSPSPDLKLPRPWYGVYFCVGTVTFMFDERDVRRLAGVVHGDVDAFLAKRKAEKEARQRKREAAAQGEAQGTG